MIVDLNLAQLDGTNGFRLDGVGALNNAGGSVSNAGDINGDGFDDIIIGADLAKGDGFILGAGEAYVVYGSGSGFDASIDLSSLDGTNGFRIDGVGSLDLAGFSVSAAGDVNGDGVDDVIIGAPGASGDGFIGGGESYVVFGNTNGFGSSLNLSSLDGTNGFRIDGESFLDASGGSVSGAGDVNGDGIDDLIIGARFANGNGRIDSGESYVVFGTDQGFSSSLNLTSLDGTNGFRIDGIDRFDNSGVSVSGAGDVNGDGIDDFIIGGALANANGLIDSGESYVVFGTDQGFPSSIDLANLDGSNGFRVDGIFLFDNSGFSVSGAGDFNGDGFDDIIIGARFADANGQLDAGQSYVLFGTDQGFPSSIDLITLNGSNGFRLDGVDAFDNSGFSVSGAGDVNGDGFDDLIIGAPGADGNGIDAGEAYVVFGTAAPMGPDFDLSSLDGENGYRISGIDGLDNAGRSVSGAGDVNGDGIDDLIIGARFADGNGKLDAGESYVIFGVKKNDPPEAEDDHISIGEDAGPTNITHDLLQNDTDPDGDPITITAIDASGTTDLDVSLVNGEVTVTPGASYNALAAGETATETFTYTITDDDGETSTATATITIVGANDGPTAHEDAFTFGENDGANWITNRVLANDVDPDNGAHLEIVEIDAAGAKGSVQLVNGQLIYDPSGQFENHQEGDFEYDTFSYVVSDGEGGRSRTTVTITIEGSNDDPMANQDGSAFHEDEGVRDITGDLLANDFDIDGDALTITNIDATHIGGDLQLNNGQVTFNPNGAYDYLAEGESVTQTYTYTIEDGFGGSDTATSLLVIEGRNDDPHAAADMLTHSEDEGPVNVTWQIMSNDTDVDASDALSVMSVDASGTVGSVTMENGQVHYDTNGQYDHLKAGETATDTFSYTVSDGHGGQSTATVAVTIEGVNDSPVAQDDMLSLGEDAEDVDVTGLLLANDNDVDGEALTVTSVNADGLKGGLALVNGAVVYSASPMFQALGEGETATETFTYMVADPAGETSEATATITIIGANDNPVAGGDMATARTGETLVIAAADLLANDMDVEGDMLTIQSVSGAVNGTVSLMENGDVAFTPADGFTGPASFSYTVVDGEGGSAVAEVSVLVTETPIIGTDADDNLVGAGGLDVIEGRSGDDGLFGMEGDDTLNGEAGDDSLYGAAGADLLVGSNGDDEIFGGEGDAGKDTLDGGLGDDLLVAGAGDDTVFSGEGDDKALGGAGNDLLYGGAGDDTLMGEAGDDTAYGGEGADELYGGGGADMLDAGAGDDLVAAQDGADLVLAGAGNDTVYAGQNDNASDTLDGGDGDDLLIGFGGDDLLLGGAGSDKLHVDVGDDTLDGGADNDLLFGGAGDDLVDGGSGDDELSGNGGNDTLRGGDGNDSLYGQFGDDLLEGGAGNDIIFGGGDAGSDTLSGGAGNDTLYGLDGDDVFVFGAGDGADRIQDFSAGDMLDLSGLGADFDTVGEVLAAGAQVGGNVVFTFGADQLTLVGTDLNDLGADDLMFA
ncbi:MAG: Ig-like domain-containing protein [Pseudomonadota bacterium]